MKTFKVSSKDKKQMIQEYLEKGLSQSETARMLGISRQLVRYWVNRIRVNQKPKIRKIGRDGVV
jgi:transposase-like protein